MQSVVLYGLADLNDSITSGALSFSDGTVVKVTGAISPKGSYVDLGPGVTASSVRLTTGDTSATTKNVGLGEIEICASSSLALRVLLEPST